MHVLMTVAREPKLCVAFTLQALDMAAAAGFDVEGAGPEWLYADQEALAPIAELALPGGRDGGGGGELAILPSSSAPSGGLTPSARARSPSSSTPSHDYDRPERLRRRRRRRRSRTAEPARTDDAEPARTDDAEARSTERRHDPLGAEAPPARIWRPRRAPLPRISFFSVGWKRLSACQGYRDFPKFDRPPTEERYYGSVADSSGE